MLDAHFNENPYPGLWLSQSHQFGIVFLTRLPSETDTHTKEQIADECNQAAERLSSKFTDGRSFR